MSNLAPYWKAIVGFITPGAVLIGAAVTDNSQGGTTITTPEWVTALVACIVTSGAVYVAPKNAEPPPDEGGQVDVAFLLVLATFILVLLMFLGVHARL